MNRDFVVKPEVFDLSIGARPVAVHFGPGLYRFLDEGLKVFLVSPSQSLDTDTAKSFGQDFHGDRHHYLGRVALTPLGRNGALSVSQRQIGFIHFDLSVKEVTTRSDHGATQAVQHGPGRLIAPEPEDALEAQCTDALLLVGDIPNCSEPDSQFGSGFVKN